MQVQIDSRRKESPSEIGSVNWMKAVYSKHTFLVAFSISILAIIFLLWVIHYRLGLPHPTPGNVSSPVLTPYEDDVCPGGYVVFDLNIKFPEDVFFDTWRILKNSKSQTVYWERGVPPFVVMTAGSVLSTTLSFPVPENAQPGSYTYFGVLNSHNADPSIYRVPFEVIDCD